MDLGIKGTATEITGPRSFSVVTEHRHLTALEDGELRGYNEHHLFIIDEATGQLMVEGAYGTFAYAWPPSHRAKGMTLAAFLLRIDFDYFMNKASRAPHVIADIPPTIAMLRRDLLTDRRRGHMEKDSTRRIWDELLDDIDPAMNETEYVNAMWNNPVLSEHYCDGSNPPMVTREDPGLRRFWDEVWSVFRTQVLTPVAAAEQEACAAAA